MEHYHCLNCNEPVSKNFCPNCGQKTDTHRITFKHFIAHDLLHGVWHLERGILFTLKETLTRPGKAALDYIDGKRIRYYNIFYLCLLVIGVHILLVHLYDTIHPKRMHEYDKDMEIMDFFSKYLKLILLAVVPIIALDARLVFRRLKLNLAEHFILSGINLLGMLVFALFFLFFNFLNEFAAPVVVGWLEVLSFLFIMLFPTWTYLNATQGKYKFFGYIWRILVFNIIILTQMLLILSAIYLVVTKSSDLVN